MLYTGESQLQSAATAAAKPEPDLQVENEPFELTDMEKHVKAKGNYLSQVLLCWSL